MDEALDFAEPLRIPGPACAWMRLERPLDVSYAAFTRFLRTTGRFVAVRLLVCG